MHRSLLNSNHGSCTRRKPPVRYFGEQLGLLVYLLGERLDSLVQILEFGLGFRRGLREPRIHGILQFEAMAQCVRGLERVCRSVAILARPARIPSVTARRRPLSVKGQSQTWGC
jgi:hypothetical protein